MTQDFANKKRAPKKLRPSSNRRKANKKLQTFVPAWIWLSTGIALGILIVLLLYWAVTQLEPSGASDVRPQHNEVKQPQPRFDFYQLLKDQEVTVPDTTPELENRSEEDTVYLLQAGSFRNNADADRLRAQLLLLNLTAIIEKTNARNGENWHRVLVGPFKSRSKLAKARSILASHQIDSLLLKRR